VMYDYETTQYRRMLEDAGWQVGVGSFSDISYLTHLGCMGFNVGVGYKDYHALGAYFDVNVYLMAIAKFAFFYDQHSQTLLKHEQNKWGSSQISGYSYSDWRRDDVEGVDYDYSYDYQNGKWVGVYKSDALAGSLDSEPDAYARSAPAASYYARSKMDPGLEASAGVTRQGLAAMMDTAEALLSNSHLREYKCQLDAMALLCDWDKHAPDEEYEPEVSSFYNDWIYLDSEDMDTLVEEMCEGPRGGLGQEVTPNAEITPEGGLDSWAIDPRDKQGVNSGPKD
jgi:hypothetical protein